MKTKHIIILLISATVIFFSCGNNKTKPPEAIVKVVIKDTDGDETPVSAVTVKLYSNPNGSYIDVSNQTLENPDSLTLEGAQITDGLGFVRFQTVYDCILSVQATYIDEDKVEFKGKTILIFKQEEVFEKTLILK